MHFFSLYYVCRGNKPTEGVTLYHYTQENFQWISIWIMAIYQIVRISGFFLFFLSFFKHNLTCKIISVIGILWHFPKCWLWNLSPYSGFLVHYKNINLKKRNHLTSGRHRVAGSFCFMSTSICLFAQQIQSIVNVGFTQKG